VSTVLETNDGTAAKLIVSGTNGLPQSLYTFQLPLSQASGPDSSALGHPIVMFSAYSYLGLIGHPRLATAVKEAVERYVGSRYTQHNPQAGDGPNDEIDPWPPFRDGPRLQLVGQGLRLPGPSSRRPCA
jgi:7-keto-8-aminopelargonate synthetase-like enzyme